MLVDGPRGGIKHDHFAFVQGTPQLGVGIFHLLCRIQAPWSIQQDFNGLGSGLSG